MRTLPLITLLTDFGGSDHYVANMKGVILSICPEARLVDISHEITACGILEASWTLAQSWTYFPAGTIHLVVVDPGVGSNRRAVLVEAAGHFFVAPDNGVLSMVLDSATGSQARHITADRFFRHPVSHTFHGRDIFAPVAANLAAGIPPAEFGPPIEDLVRLANIRPVQDSPGRWSGCVLKIDHFGNIVTSFDFGNFAWVSEQPFEMSVGQGAISRYVAVYDRAIAGETFVIPGSAGFLELSVKQQSAARRLGVRAGDPIDLRRVIR